MFCKQFSLGKHYNNQVVKFTFGYVQIKEVTVENGLDTAGNDGDQVKETLRVVTVDPVEDVECPVNAERKQIVTGYCFCLTSFTDHKQLGQDRDRLQVDGERPQDLSE